MCFLLLLSSMLSFFSLLILSSPSIHSEEMRQQEAGWKSKLESTTQMLICIIASVSVRDREERRGMEGIQLAVGQKCPHWAGSHTAFNGKCTLGDDEDGEQQIDCCVPISNCQLHPSLTLVFPVANPVLPHEIVSKHRNGVICYWLEWEIDAVSSRRCFYSGVQPSPD